MRVQVLTPFHWDGVLRVRGDVLEGDDAELIAADDHYRAFVVVLAETGSNPPVIGRAADIPDAPAEPDSHPVEPPMADEHDEEQ